MKIMGIFLIFVFFISCTVKKNEMNIVLIFKNALLKDWIYTTEIGNIYERGELITRPIGSEVLIFNLKFLDKNGEGLKEHCFYYQIPYKQLLGKVTVTENKNKEKCEETSNGNVIASLDNINQLRIDLSNFQLVVSFTRKNQFEQLSFPLINLVQGSIHEKVESEKWKSKIPNLFLIRGNNNLNESERKNVGKINDSFENRSAIICKKVNRKCELVGENICEHCRYGSYEVASFNCPKGGIRICGINHCGQKGAPACPRGEKSQDGEVDGICESDLKTVRDNNGILVCQ
jgi:hypothetical protein